MVLLSTAYFPPIEYFALLAGGPVRIEACENYQKQSYRNRCKILAAGGVEPLNVPVVHERGTFSLPIREIRVDYRTPWVRRTERAIDSAYRSSAYFDYYRDGVFGILDEGYEHLWDLNIHIIRFFAEAAGLKAEIIPTEEFVASPAGEDFRNTIHPKKADTILRDMNLEKPYFQVFSGKYGFVPNLSIMDLVFNEGPGASDYLIP